MLSRSPPGVVVLQRAAVVARRQSAEGKEREDRSERYQPWSHQGRGDEVTKLQRWKRTYKDTIAVDAMQNDSTRSQEQAIELCLSQFDGPRSRCVGPLYVSGTRKYSARCAGPPLWEAAERSGCPGRRGGEEGRNAYATGRRDGRCDCV